MVKIKSYEEEYRVVSFNCQKFLYESIEDPIKRSVSNIGGQWPKIRKC